MPTPPPAAETPPPRRFAVSWRALAAGTAALALFAWVLRGSEVSRGMAVLRELGPLLPLALVPYLVLTLLETGGWHLAVRSIGARAPLRGLLSVRLVADAVALSVPSGPLVTEALQPYLLQRYCGLAYGDGMASMVARKMFAVAGHGLCLALAVAWAYPALSRASYRLIGGPMLPALLLMAATVLVLTSFSLAAVTSRGHLGGKLWQGLRRLPLGRLRGWIERGGPTFLATDERLARLFARGPRAWLLPVPYFLLLWAGRAVENLVLLRMVGIEVGFRELIALEPSLVIMRSVFSILPGGLGVQDLGCLLFLEAMGVGDAAVVGGAYVLLRRGKELVFIAAGYLILALRR